MAEEGGPSLHDQLPAVDEILVERGSRQRIRRKWAVPFTFLHALAILSLILGTVAMTCYSENMYGGYLSDSVCIPLALLVDRAGSTDERGRPSGPNSILSILMLSLSMIFSSACVYPVYASKRIRTKAPIGNGDSNMRRWSILLVLMPSVWVYLSGTMVRLRTSTEDNLLYSIIRRSASPTGTAGILCLGFFMVPVSRQSPLLAALGLPPIHALSLHIWAGRISFFFIILHSVLFSLIYGVRGVRDGEAFLSSLISALIPPRECRSFTGIMGFLDTDTREVIMGARSSHGRHASSGTNSTDAVNATVAAAASQGEDGGAAHCHGYWRNFYGLLGTLSLLILVLTSLNIVRRRNYRVFYISHIIFGSAMLVFSIIHYSYIVLFLMPSILYYLSATSPMFVQAVASACLDKGVKMEQSRILAHSNGCAEMTFSKSVVACKVESKQAAPYVRICVPSISMLWYPFTVATTPDRVKLKILFRKYGYFTESLWKVLDDDEAREPPVVLIDGFWFGSDWIASALRHDVVVMATGGIAVTPFLTFLPMLVDRVLRMDASDES